MLTPKEFVCYKTNRKVLNSVEPQNRKLTKFNTFLMEKVLKVAKKLQQKIHPDKNTDVKTEELSKLVNQAADKIIKTDFS